VFAKVAVVGTFVLGDVQMILVAIHNQRDLRDISLVHTIAGDSLLHWPTAQMAGSFPQAPSEEFRLLEGLFR